MGLWDQAWGWGEAGRQSQSPLSSSSSTGTAVAGPWLYPACPRRMDEAGTFHTTSYLHISVKHLPKSLPILKSSNLSLSCVFLGDLYPV